MRRALRTIATPLKRAWRQTRRHWRATAVYAAAGLSLYFLGQPLAVSSSQELSQGTAWQQVSPWVSQGNALTTTLETKVSSLACASGASLEFPNIMHARQDVYLDGRLIATNGDANTIRSIYGAPIISCRVLNGETLTWKVEAFVREFAKIRDFPRLSSSSGINREEVLHLATFGSNFLIAIFLLASTWRTTFFRQALRIASFSVSMGLFLAFSVFGLLGFQLNYLDIDKLAGLALGFAILSFVSFLHKRQYIASWFNQASELLCAVCMALILFLPDGDKIQGVLNVMFLPGVISTWIGLYAVISGQVVRERNQKFLSVLALGSFAAATSLDVAYTYGLHNLGMTLAYGITGVVLFFGLVIQAEIREMNLEREHLRSNLANEVALKTSSLENALTELKNTQAELIQSAKLASLGTLSAGIAHEINNSLNYVNGGLQPLEKLITKSCHPDDRPKIDKLLGVMKEGLALTLEIIKSLRTYTGLNQAKFNDVELKGVIQSSLTILRAKLRGRIEVHLEVADDLKVFGSVVGINQIFMNLISNAIDAMTSGGSLAIAASRRSDGWAEVSITDTGSGMPPEVSERIFEPFFTTKTVGSGTGLGLHIVKGEIERHHGTIRLASAVGVGTTFVLAFPPAHSKETIIDRSAS